MRVTTRATLLGVHGILVHLGRCSFFHLGRLRCAQTTTRRGTYTSRIEGIQSACLAAATLLVFDVVSELGLIDERCALEMNRHLCCLKHDMSALFRAVASIRNACTYIQRLSVIASYVFGYVRARAVI